MALKWARVLLNIIFIIFFSSSYFPLVLCFLIILHTVGILWRTLIFYTCCNANYMEIINILCIIPICNRNGKQNHTIWNPYKTIGRKDEPNIIFRGNLRGHHSTELVWISIKKNTHDILITISICFILTENKAIRLID